MFVERWDITEALQSFITNICITETVDYYVRYIHNCYAKFDAQFYWQSKY